MSDDYISLDLSQYSAGAHESGDDELVSVDDAIAGSSMYELTSVRDTTRVLFITRDTSVLNQTKQTLDGYVDISELFDEVHIVILRPGIRPKNPVLRVSKNVWVYIASAAHWWWTPIIGYSLVRSELEFADGFRPDLIVARDPFECGLLAYILGNRYNRPTQLHILENYLTREYRSQGAANRWRSFLAKFIIPRFSSVRTATTKIETKINKKFQPPDISTLPRMNHFESYANAQSTIDLKEKYRPFVFVMLFIGNLNHQSTLPRVLDMAQFVLRNPRVGLVVIGDGPARREFERKAEMLGIREQVVFEKKVTDMVGYLKAAQILIVTDTDIEADQIAVRGAAAGTPLMLSHTEYRNDLFVDGKSALLCLAEDIECYSSKLGLYLNNISLRREMGKRGQLAVLDKLQDDPKAYRQAYKDSIEEAFMLDTEADSVESVDDTSKEV